MSPNNQQVQQAAALLKAGQKEEARQILIQIVRQEPNNVFAWYVLSYCVDDISQKRSCLQRALALDPQSGPVKQALEKLNNPAPIAPPVSPVELRPTPPPAAPPPSPVTREAAPHPPTPSTPPATQAARESASTASVTPAAGSTARQAGPAANEPAPAQPKATAPAPKTAATAQRPSVEKKAAPPATGSSSGGNQVIAILMVVGVVGLIGVVLLFTNNQTLSLAGLVLVLGAIGFAIYWFYIRHPQPSHTVGKERPLARAGATTAQSFSELVADPGAGFTLIRNVAASNGTISYLIISETGGIFPIDAPLYVGKIDFKQDQLLVNKQPPERDFIEISLQNAFWLRDRLEPMLGSKPWVTPVLVFPNASVPYTLPIKGVHVIDQKELFRTLELESAKRSNPLIWEKREEIRQFLQGE